MYGASTLFLDYLCTRIGKSSRTGRSDENNTKKYNTKIDIIPKNIPQQVLTNHKDKEQSNAVGHPHSISQNKIISNENRDNNQRVVSANKIISTNNSLERNYNWQDIVSY